MRQKRNFKTFTYRYNSSLFALQGKLHVVQLLFLFHFELSHFLLELLFDPLGESVDSASKQSQKSGASQEKREIDQPGISEGSAAHGVRLEGRKHGGSAISLKS